MSWPSEAGKWPSRRRRIHEGRTDEVSLAAYFGRPTLTSGSAALKWTQPNMRFFSASVARVVTGLMAVSALSAAGCTAILGIDDPETIDSAPASDADSATRDSTALDSSAASSGDAGASDTSTAETSVVDRHRADAPAPDVGAPEASAADRHVADATGLDAGPLTLYGATVNLSIHCCTAPPDTANLAGSYTPAVVGPEVEFPAVGTSDVLNAKVDVKPSSIYIYPTASTSLSGGFNGYVFVFSPTPPATPEIPRIESATLDKTSTVPLANVAVTLVNGADGTSTVEVNVAGTMAPADATLIVDLVLGKPDAD
jgi:hypothetical protein